MKHLSFLALFLLCIVEIAFSQTYSTQYGKVTDYELSMTSYEADTSAVAVCLARDCEMKYFYKEGFVLEYEYFIKIKILKPEGVKYGDFSQFISKKYDKINNIKGVTYNLENGKVEKKKLEKKYIFEEVHDDYLLLMKMAMPGVKEGSVIELKYTVASHDLHPNKWFMQTDIPVESSTLTFTYPEYFLFNIESRGKEHIEIKDERVNSTFVVNNGTGQSYSVNCSATWREYKSSKLPSISSDETMIWNTDDYKNQLIFVLNGTNFPGDVYRPYSPTWDVIDKKILESDSFGKYLTEKSPFAEQQSAIDLNSLSVKDKACAVFNLMKENVKWNKHYSFYGKQYKKVIKDGEGSNSELNFIFMSMLRDAGIACVPVVMRTRSLGLLPISIPSHNDLSTFCVAFLDENSKIVYMDSSIEDGIVNVLPTKMLVDRARVLMPTTEMQVYPSRQQFVNIQNAVGDRWMDLTGVGVNNTTIQINASISAEGTISGTVTQVMNGIDRLDNIKEYSEAKDSIDYIEKREKNLGLKFESYMRRDKGGRLIESMKFTRNPNSTAGELIYINPIITPHLQKNMLTQTGRTLPVEFAHKQTHIVTVSISLPENLEIESLPESTKMIINGNGIK